LSKEGENQIDRIKNIIDGKIFAEGGELPNEYTLLQPEKFSFNRNNYVHVLNQLRNLIKFSK
jgi:hypothetical protein